MRGYGKAPAERIGSDGGPDRSTELLGSPRDGRRVAACGALAGGARHERCEAGARSRLVDRAPEQVHAEVDDRRVRALTDEHGHARARAVHMRATVGPLVARRFATDGERRWLGDLVKRYAARDRGGKHRLRGGRVGSQRRSSLGAIGNDRHVVRVEVPADRCVHIGRGGIEEPGKVPVAELPVAEGFPFGEVRCLTVHGLEPAQPARLIQAARADQLALAYSGVAQVHDLGPRGARGLRNGIGIRLAVDHEHTKLGRGVVVRTDGRGQSAVAHGAVQSRGAAAAKYGSGEVEQRRVGVVGARRAPREGKLRLHDVAGPFAPAEPGRRDLRFARNADGHAGRECPPAALDVAEHCVDVKVSDHRQDGVRWTVEVAVEAGELVARERAQPGLAPDAPPADAMPVVQKFVERLRGHCGGVVRLALRLLDDDLELAGKFVAVDQRVGVGVELDVESRRRARHGEDRVIDRVIVDRSRVEVATTRLGGLGDLPDTARGRPLEVHVLEHVGDADDVVGLVEVAGLDPRDDGDDGRRRIAPEQDGEAIGEDHAAHVIRGGGATGGCGRCHAAIGRLRRITRPTTTHATP